MLMGGGEARLEAAANPPALYGVDVLCVHCILYSRIHLADFMFLLYIAQSRQSAWLFLQSSELGPPPSTAGECVPPSFGSRGGTLACV
jgi:hypothetical protein